MTYRTSIRLSPYAHDGLRRLAKSRGETLQSLMTKALLRYVDREEEHRGTYQGPTGEPARDTREDDYSP